MLSTRLYLIIIVVLGLLILGCGTQYKDEDVLYPNPSGVLKAATLKTPAVTPADMVYNIVLLKTITERIHPSLPEFTFKLYGLKGHYRDFARRLEILRADKPDEPFQVINFPKSKIFDRYPEMQGPDVFVIEDMNFDGYKDFRIMEGSGNVNRAYLFWVWDKDTSQFIQDHELEQLNGFVTLTVDYEDKRIVVDSTDPQHHRRIYQYINGHVTETQVIDLDKHTISQ
jgi:hypothetical protein